jgi:hypothetical protein
MTDTITDRATGLQEAMAPIAQLTGGMTGAATLTADSPFANLAQFAEELGDKMSAALPFNSDQLLAPVNALGQMKGHLQAPPTGALDGFGIKMEQTEGGLANDFPTAVAQTVGKLNEILDQVPSDPSALASVLLDQIVAVFGTLDGPEAAQIKAWIASLDELIRDLQPVIAAAQSSNDPMTIAVEIIGRSIRATADIFGLDQLETLLNFFDRLLDEPLPASLLTTIDGAITTFDGALTSVKAKAAAEVEELRTVVLAAAEQLRALKELLRPAMDVLVKIASAPILQPGELEKQLRAAIDAALGVKVQDVATVDDPYKALLDKIDAAIAGIDLASVRASVLEALHTLRDTIAKADLDAAGEALQQALQPVQDTVDSLQAGASELLDDLKGALQQASGEVHTLAESVGAFAPDGTYTFSLAGQLHDALTTVRDVVSGDIAGALDEFKNGADEFLSQLTNLLQPVEDAISDAATEASQAITDFAGFMEDLDVPKLLEDLAKKVDDVVHALTPIDFKTLTDPVIAGLEENAEKIKGIDASKLNDLLKQALSAALDLIIGIDISKTIEPELRKKLDDVKKVPAEVVGELQERYEQALGMLDQLRPSQLLEALFAAFDTISKAISGLDAAQLLGPLDALHQRTLHQPVADLKPATLLTPLEDAFRELQDAVEELKGTELLAPVQHGLDELKATVGALDLTGPIDDLRGTLAGLTATLEAMKPSGLIEPIADDLTKLEAELDRFKPSVVFAPIAALATPLLALLEDVQQEAVTALHDAVQAPMAQFERLKPEKLQAELQARLDGIIAAIESLKLPARYEALRKQHAEFKVAATAAGGALRADLVLLIDVELELKGFVTAHDLLLTALRNLKRELKLDGLQEAYDQLEQRMLDLLPPWGRALLDPAAFKLIMQMANPLRFLDELDARFETVKQKLIPITPQEIGAELDAAHAEVLQQVHDLGLDERLVQVKAMIEQLRGIVTGLRIDFVADEVDRALADVRAVVAALDPAQLAPDLDGLHADVVAVVDAAKPSLVLANLNAPLAALKDVVHAVDPREQLGKPLDEAWKAIDARLGEVDVAAVVAPVDARLDELEKDFETELERVEKAVDDMLRAARGVLSSSGASASVGGGF